MRNDYEGRGSSETGGGYEVSETAGQTSEVETAQENFNEVTTDAEVSATAGTETSDATVEDFNDAALDKMTDATPEVASETDDEDPGAFNDAALDKMTDATPETASKTDDENPGAFNDADAESANETKGSNGELTNETEKTTYAQLQAYMEDHHYGPQHAAEYTQDPQWQSLNNAYRVERGLEPIDYGRKDWTDTHVEDTRKELEAMGIPADSPELAAILRNEQDGINAIRAEEAAAREATDLNTPVDKATAEQLAKGEVTDKMFSTTGIPYTELKENTKLEELSREEYNKLETVDPKAASKLLTEYNDRHIVTEDLNDLPRQLQLDNHSGLEVIDPVLSEDKVTVKDTSTGETYTVYPNPMGRMSHMDGQQGQNSLGMQQDCGIASAAKGTNDVYGKRVTSEERMANYAYATGNCEIERRPDGSTDMSNSGGTWEGNVEEFYKANGLETEKYVGSEVPEPEVLAEQIKNGGVVSLAVSSDILWNWEEAQSFDPRTDLDAARYHSDQEYQDHVHNLVRMQRGGTFKADHFVNVSNVVCDNQGNVTHFIVSDTGNGTTKMISAEHLHRAYNGDGKVSVSAQGCVIARRK